MKWASAISASACRTLNAARISAKIATRFLATRGEYLGRLSQPQRGLAEVAERGVLSHRRRHRHGRPQIVSCPANFESLRR
jgi:hypothetical protein